jgi:hypothetical protein
MRWVSSRDYDDMPSMDPHREGWIRVRRASVWAKVHEHLLLADPTNAQQGLVRANQLFANTLFAVYNCTSSRRRFLGSDTLRLDFLDRCWDNLANLGLEEVPHTHREELKEKCAKLVAQDPQLFTPRESDWTDAPIELRPPGGLAPTFELIPYEAPHGSDGRLSEVADIFHYGANFLLAVDRSSRSYTEKIVSFLISELERHDSALANMGRRHKGSRLLALMNKAPIPSFLSTWSDSVEMTYSGVADRVKWAFGTETEKERILMSKALQLCEDRHFPKLKCLMLEGPCPVRSNAEAAELLLRLARLIKASAYENKHLTLSSYSALLRLEEYLHKERGVFETESVRNLLPGARIAALERKQAVLETSWRNGSSTGGAQATGSSGFPREMFSELNKVVSDRASMELEEQLEVMLADPNGDEMEICYLITRSKHDIYLKVLLGHIDWLSIRPIFGKLISRVVPTWERFATLVLVAGIDGWRQASERQKDFELPAGVLDKLKTDSTKVSFINDIFAPIAKDVLKAAWVPPKNQLEQLMCSFYRGKEREVGDRAYWLLGYAAEETAGASVDLTDSFAAVIDSLGGFIEEGAPLGGDRMRRHEGLALSFYNKARAEHAKAHARWVVAKDPAHEHPPRWLPANAVSRATLEANQRRLEKLLDILDYAPEVLTGKTPLCHAARCQ